MPSAVGPTSDPWDDGDTLADWAEDEGRPVVHLSLAHERWRYWARKIPRRDDEGEMTPATSRGNLGP